METALSLALGALGTLMLVAVAAVLILVCLHVRGRKENTGRMGRTLSRLFYAGSCLCCGLPEDANPQPKGCEYLAIPIDDGEIEEEVAHVARPLLVDSPSPACTLSILQTVTGLSELWEESSRNAAIHSRRDAFKGRPLLQRYCLASQATERAAEQFLHMARHCLDEAREHVRVSTRPVPKRALYDAYLSVRAAQVSLRAAEFSLLRYEHPQSTPDGASGQEVTRMRLMQRSFAAALSDQPASRPVSLNAALPLPSGGDYPAGPRIPGRPWSVHTIAKPDSVQAACGGRQPARSPPCPTGRARMSPKWKQAVPGTPHEPSGTDHPARQHRLECLSAALAADRLASQAHTSPRAPSLPRESAGAGQSADYSVRVTAELVPPARYQPSFPALPRTTPTSLASRLSRLHEMQRSVSSPRFWYLPRRRPFDAEKVSMKSEIASHETRHKFYLPGRSRKRVEDCSRMDAQRNGRGDLFPSDSDSREKESLVPFRAGRDELDSTDSFRNSRFSKLSQATSQIVTLSQASAAPPNPSPPQSYSNLGNEAPSGTTETPPRTTLADKGLELLQPNHLQPGGHALSFGSYQQTDSGNRRPAMGPLLTSCPELTIPAAVCRRDDCSLCPPSQHVSRTTPSSKRRAQRLDPGDTCACPAPPTLGRPELRGESADSASESTWDDSGCSPGLSDSSYLATRIRDVSLRLASVVTAQRGTPRPHAGGSKGGPSSDASELVVVHDDDSLLNPRLNVAFVRSPAAYRRI